MKGNPNSGAFRKGQTAHNLMPVGTVRLRTHEGDHERAWIKTAEPNEWRPRAIVVWEDANGGCPVPDGCVVHHDNRNALDDRIENLILLTRAEHLNEHRDEF
jgi:hypothetical protein